MAKTTFQQGEEALAQLHRLVLPFVLRRLKSDVLKELPVCFVVLRLETSKLSVLEPS